MPGSRSWMRRPTWGEDASSCPELHTHFPEVCFTTLKCILLKYTIQLLLGIRSDPRTFSSPAEPCAFSSSPSPKSWQPLIYILSQHICVFWTFHINGTVEYTAFCSWLLALVTLPGFTHTAAYAQSFIPTDCPVMLHLRTYHILFSFHWLLDIWVVSTLVLWRIMVVGQLVKSC